MLENVEKGIQLDWRSQNNLVVENRPNFKIRLLLNFLSSDARKDAIYLYY